MRRTGCLALSALALLGSISCDGEGTSQEESVHDLRGAAAGATDSFAGLTITLLDAGCRYHTYPADCDGAEMILTMECGEILTLAAGNDEVTLVSAVGTLSRVGEDTPCSSDIALALFAGCKGWAESEVPMTLPADYEPDLMVFPDDDVDKLLDDCGASEYVDELVLSVALTFEAAGETHQVLLDLPVSADVWEDYDECVL